jgi:hypothetical protein
MFETTPKKKESLLPASPAICQVLAVAQKMMSLHKKAVNPKVFCISQHSRYSAPCNRSRVLLSTELSLKNTIRKQPSAHIHLNTAAEGGDIALTLKRSMVQLQKKYHNF